ncbi:MAG: bifunctional folylpolyglutamate synthase/dihydrofolate synthase [Nitrospirae bacterium]|nr:bifunctional folylpolyglutamate synthase/dihydrofolate synthase [Nitrospirota bacterium]
MGYDDAVSYLYSLRHHGIKLGLENPIRLLTLIGNPHSSFRSIHIAGTNGKGSTSALIASILRAYGFNVGLFTSPHIVSFTERIRVNEAEIKEEEVVSLTEELRERIEGFMPTFFEFVTAMGLLYFKRKAVDWAVIETGMGGRLDATNVINPEVSVITHIGCDHKEFLGDTLEEIAGEKAGIIKPNTPVVTCPQGLEVMNLIAKKAGDNSSPLYIMGRDFSVTFKAHTETGICLDYTSHWQAITDLRIPLHGRYQAENAGLAIEAVEIAVPKKNSPELIQGMSSLIWHGRFEFINEHILIDGAHNPDAAKALSQELKENPLTKDKEITLIIGIMADKDIEGILRALLPLANEVIFVSLPYERAAPPEKLKQVSASLGYESKTAGTVKDAIERLKTPLGVITGSFYTIGEAKEAIGEMGILKRLRE